jgi:histidine triad (HIT) family protein
MENCIFCKIARGEVPTNKVAENDLAFAFLDNHPANPGHTLVIPKRHAVTVMDTTPEEWRAISDLVHTLSRAIETATKADGLNLKMNNREHGGQDVMHAHMHIIPRYENDGVVKKLVQNHEYKEGEAQTVIEKIHTAMT